MKPSTRVAKMIDNQPVKRLAAAAGQCSVQAEVYGSCIVANYKDVSKGMCQKEFAGFKDCVQKVMGRKW